MGKQTTTRNPSMDVIRCFALLSVVFVHFFQNSGYLNYEINNVPMVLMTFLRTFTMMGVALFLMLSGYLMQRKQPSLQYYLKVIRVLAIYAMAGTCCYTYLRHHVTQDPFTSWFFFDLLSNLFNFFAAPYGWYVRMYLGLFLLIPYLNVLYHGLDTQKKKLGLLATMLLLTSVPPAVHVLTYSSGQGLFLGTHGIQKILPDWWKEFYPVTFYFLGAYLRDYPLKINWKTNLLLLLGVVLAEGGFSIYISHGGTLQQGSWLEDGAMFNVMQSFLLFNLLAQANYKWVGPRLAKFLACLSNLTLGAYLVSWIFDYHYYPIYNEMTPTLTSRMIHFPVIVSAVFVSSLALSAVIQLIYGLFAKLFGWIWTKAFKRTCT